MNRRTLSTTSSRRQGWRDTAALVSCVCFFLVAALVAMLFAARGYGLLFSLAATSVLPLRHFLGMSTTLLSSLVLGGYVGITLWLACARFVFGFTREEVVRCAHAGPHSPFDDWLIGRFYSSPPPEA